MSLTADDEDEKDKTVCVCGHAWIDHHICCPMCTPGDLVAQECEATQFEGQPINPEEPVCPCQKYQPKQKE